MEQINVLQHLGALQGEADQLRETLQETQHELGEVQLALGVSEEARQLAEQELRLVHEFLGRAGAPADPTEQGLSRRLAWVLGELEALRRVPARANGANGVNGALEVPLPPADTVRPSVQGNVFTWRHGPHVVRAIPPGAAGQGWTLESAWRDRPYTVFKRCHSWDQLWVSLVGCCDERGFTPGGRRLLAAVRGSAGPR